MILEIYFNFYLFNILKNNNSNVAIYFKEFAFIIRD
jgi:hypothetical protein